MNYDVQLVKEVVTETAHRLINYDGRCAHVHGHSWKWKIGIVATVPFPIPDSDKGMILDFAKLKEWANDILDKFDHALLLHEKDPLLRAISHIGCLDGTNGEKGRVLLFPFNPTSENLAMWVTQELSKRMGDIGNLDIMPSSVYKRVTVHCNETASSQCSVL